MQKARCRALVAAVLITGAAGGCSSHGHAASSSPPAAHSTKVASAPTTTAAAPSATDKLQQGCGVAAATVRAVAGPGWRLSNAGNFCLYARAPLSFSPLDTTLPAAVPPGAAFGRALALCAYVHQKVVRHTRATAVCASLHGVVGIAAHPGYLLDIQAGRDPVGILTPQQEGDLVRIVAAMLERQTAAPA